MKTHTNILLYFSCASVLLVTREQVAKTAFRDGTLTNTAAVTSATAMVTIVNLETAMRLYATVDHLSLDQTVLMSVS